MATLLIELPPQQSLKEANLRRWAEVVSDPKLARLEERVETNRFGHIIMSPPPSARHGSYQSRICALLDKYMKSGRVVSECPISTADGVKAADVAWASPARLAELEDQPCFPRAPEICVEILSPGNTEEEIRNKTALYFDAGAREVWYCADDGRMTFLPSRKGQAMRASRLCPEFPARVGLRESPRRGA